MTSSLIADLPPDRLPKHIAIIMDGNGRWAKKQGRIRLFGHRQGITSVRETVRECSDLGIKYLTLYAFSMENWSRPEKEIKGLWALLKHFVKSERPEMKKNGVRLAVIGHLDRLPQNVQDEIETSMRELAGGLGMLLTIALSYSGRDEIVGAVKEIARKAAEGRLDPDTVDESFFSGALQTRDMPDPDLLIRTSGEVRISNFLLWQIAYSEIHVTDALWPDFNREDLHKAISDYARRERRFGKTGEQIQQAGQPEGAPVKAAGK